MADSSADCSSLALLEQALTRVEAAAARLQQSHANVQARYELLDRAGSEILTTLDALLADRTEPELRPEQSGLRLEPPKPRTLPSTERCLVATADAA